MIKEFATYISNQTGFVIGTTLFTTSWDDDSPDMALLVSERGGPNPTWSTSRFTSDILIFSRAFDWVTARENIESVSEALRKLGPVTLPTVETGVTWTVEGMTVDQWQHLGQDDMKRHQYSMSCLVNLSKA